MRMFADRVGEFAVYVPEDSVRAVEKCAFCLNGTESFDKCLESWKKEKNNINHVHLCACMTLCPCGNYEKIKSYFLSKGLTVGEFRKEES